MAPLWVCLKKVAKRGENYGIEKSKCVCNDYDCCYVCIFNFYWAEKQQW